MSNPKDKIRKLLRLYRDQPSTPEGQTAYKQAKRIMAKHGLTEDDFKPRKKKPEPKREPYVAPPRGGFDPTNLPFSPNGQPRTQVKDFDDAVDKTMDAFTKFFER